MTERACAHCGFDAPVAAKFCSECGARLQAPSSLSEERKVVTVLFCDLVDFTARADGADPEDVHGLVLGYHRLLRRAIEGFGGTVEKFIGDAVMGVFGAPAVHEDDPERAVRAARAIVDAIVDYDPDLQVRVGIETGEALVTLGSRPELGQPMVTGDVVNTAARLQTSAPAGAIVVGPHTWRRTAAEFDLVELPAAPVKGKAEPLARWRVDAATRRARKPAGTNAAPMVGRDAELGWLVAEWQAVAAEGRLRMVSVHGEPGSGKSRLLAELASAVGDAGWWQGQCLPYGDGVSFWALGEIVKARAGIRESDGANVAATRLDAVVAQGGDRDWLLSRLRPLVGLEASAATSQEESFTAWRSFCASLAASGPCVVVFEDMHWADDAMLDFVAQLARSDEPVPLLVVCSARPELLDRRPDWVHGASRAIGLDPLTSEQTGHLVRALLEGAEVDPAVLEELVSRAGGNPLYAEQFVQVTRSGGAPAAGLPDSVQAVIAARLDVLESPRKSVLQDAAVVGHVFWSGAVSAIGAREPRTVERDLDALADQQFVRPNADSSMRDDHEFSFWHAIVRDVCYSQIPRAGRATRHRRAAAWIEHRAGERLDDLADVLAHHHTQALSLDEARGQVEEADRDAARRFLVLSGDRGMALNPVQAEAAYARALELASPGHPDRPMVLARHGDALRLNGRISDAEAALTEAVDGFRTKGPTLELGRALIALAEVLFYGLDSRASEVAEQARKLFEEVPPGLELIEVYAQLAAAANGTNDYNGVEHWFQRTSEVCTATGLPVPARVQLVHGMMRVSRGDRAGLDEMRAAVSAAESEGNYERALAATNNLILDQWIFDGPAAVFADAVDVTERSAARGITGALYYLRGLLAELRFRTGDWRTALDEQSVLADELAANGSEALSAEVRSAQVMTMVRLGRGTDAVPHLDGILSYAREVGNAQMFVEVAPVMALALATTGAQEQAQGVLSELFQLPGSCEDTALVRQFPALIRATVACGDTALGERFVAAMQRGTPAQEHGLQAGLALLAEARGDTEDAATRHADAARRWREFGDLSELTPSLIGLARCTDDPGLRQAALTEALPLLTAMGDAPLLAEARRLET